MKIYTLFLSLVCLLSFSCNNDHPSPVDKLYEDLCISPDNYYLPVKQLEFKNKNAVIRYGSGASYSYFYYIDFEGYENRFYTSCKLPEEFKQNGTKVIISGASYTYDCKPGTPCGSAANTPFVIDSIKKL